jgi:tocopherol O-methyltransferase
MILPVLAQQKLVASSPIRATRTNLNINRNAEVAGPSRRVVCQATALNEGIAKFYDASTGLWENMWGDHLHHGYYPAGGAAKSNREAQEDMIEEVLSWAGVTKVTKMVDVGCGLGGSSRHLSRKYGCSAEGITLSPFQAKRGNEISQQEGLGERVHLQVCDALNQPIEWSNNYDLVWSLESGEHMPDKTRFVGELVRICAPGGRVIVVTWCHRELAAGEKALRPEEEDLLQKICDAYFLPAWCSAGDYKKLFEAQGMTDVRTADWSNEVAPFWGEVIKSALSVKGVVGLLGAGWTTIKGALVMPLMAQGLKIGLIKFALITGVKK